MKNRASGFLKQIITILTSMAKSKTLALKSKTKAIKTRLIIFSLLRNKTMIMDSISHKLNSLLKHENQNQNSGEHSGEDSTVGDPQSNKAIVVYSDSASYLPIPNLTHMEIYENDDYPDLTHSLFDSEDVDFEDPGGSVIDLVKNSKQEGEEFRLEDEIDHVADLFIKRFHRQIRMQKLNSFKNYQEMMERSA